MGLKSWSAPEKWILAGIPALFLIGSVLHFAHQLLGQNPVAGLFFPVNESVWEHCKMVLLPVILWWSIYYCCRGKKHGISKDKWFSAALWALLSAWIAVPLLFYFYTQAFGVELLWVDIIILFAAFLFGQLVGLHLFRHGTGIPAWISICVFIFLLLVFMVFTFFPPHIPLFEDAVTAAYGIQWFI